MRNMFTEEAGQVLLESDAAGNRLREVSTEEPVTGSAIDHHT